MHPEPPETSVASPSRTISWKVVLKLVIIVLAVYLASRVSREIGWQDVLQEAEVVHRPAAALALVALISRFLAWNVRIKRILAKTLTPPPALHRLAILFASVFVNHVTISARFLGGLMRGRYLSAFSGRPFGQVYGSVFFDQLANQAAVYSSTAVALAGVLATPKGKLAAVAAQIGVLIFGWLIARQLLQHVDKAPAWIERFLRRRAKRSEGMSGTVLAESQAIFATLRQIVADRGLVVYAYLWAVVFYGLGFVAQWAVFRAVGAEVPFGVVVSVVALGSAVGVATGTPGGVGTTEAAMVSLYGRMGVDPATAAAATLLFRGAHYFVILACGLPSLIVLELARPRLRSDDVETPGS